MIQWAATATYNAGSPQSHIDECTSLEEGVSNNERFSFVSSDDIMLAQCLSWSLRKIRITGAALDENIDLKKNEIVTSARTGCSHHARYHSQSLGIHYVLKCGTCMGICGSNLSYVQ